MFMLFFLPWKFWPQKITSRDRFFLPITRNSSWKRRKAPTTTLSALVRSETGRIRFRGSTVSNTELSEFFWGSLSFGERTQWVPLSLLCVNSNSPSLSQNSPSLPQNSVRLSEFSSPKQYSRNSIPPVSKPPLTPMQGARRQPSVQAQILVVQGLLCGNSGSVSSLLRNSTVSAVFFFPEF